MASEQSCNEDAADDMNKLGDLLNQAFLLARRLEGRGVDMRTLGLSTLTLKDLRDAAENAYTLGKV